MRFTSLIIELIRARPRLVVWLVVLFQAALWLIVPLLLYRSPPGELATALAYGREYQVGTVLGPPLAFWLGDIAFRAAGNHMFGVYLLAQLCGIATFWTLYLLARAIVGGQQAVLAVLLTMTVAAFSSPGVEFGPLVLARPLWALLLLHSWQIMGQGRRSAWFAWSIEAGLLLLTIPAAIGLLMLVTGFALATERGRRTRIGGRRRGLILGRNRGCRSLALGLALGEKVALHDEQLLDLARRQVAHLGEDLGELAPAAGEREQRGDLFELALRDELVMQGEPPDEELVRRRGHEREGSGPCRARQRQPIRAAELQCAPRLRQDTEPA